MTTVTATHLGTTAPSRRADRAGRGLAAFAALATSGAFVNGVLMTISAPDDRLFVEGWRVSSFAIFAGLFALLAFRPRRSAGVWELLLAGKSALVVFGVTAGRVPEARPAAVIDFALVVVVAAAYVLCRGWLAWRSTPAA
ncbi:hypothetical protein GCM10010172_18880 [Paractinoplanes ferrugineus]|uniref:Uncharacterized protein n=1 Tax=Paractinoplanes ferrugineus TaxID=113564 RepID=A0A919J9L9_9ACTN|nr:hypothetical protein [Actinoplanes ferrugineus]GIE16688.1 hypothetical protein Afe05nite_85280 [Actinoplanes ferrugineus]